jgi:Predicted periplasmic protein
MNIYTQVAIPGSIDHLVDELREKYNRPLPAADLLTSDSYDGLMEDVVDVKDLGSGVIGGTECDHLRVPEKGCRLADLDRAGVAPLSVPVRHRDQGRGRQSGVQHSDPRLENRQRGRLGRLQLHAAAGRPSGGCG